MLKETLAKVGIRVEPSLEALRARGRTLVDDLLDECAWRTRAAEANETIIKKLSSDNQILGDESIECVSIANVLSNILDHTEDRR